MSTEPTADAAPDARPDPTGVPMPDTDTPTPAEEPASPATDAPRTGWWRHNRWWLLALPLALALAVVGSSSVYWIAHSDDGAAVVHRADSHGHVTWQTTSDGDPITVDLTLLDAQPSATGPATGSTTAMPPTGAVAWLVRMRVGPGVSANTMMMCRPRLVDDQGRTYAADAGFTDAYMFGSKCGDYDDYKTSGATITMAFGVPADATITELVMDGWTDDDSYASFPIH